MNGPETVSQCCRWEFWALCTDFATGPLKITFSGGWSQNHIQCGMVSKSHSVGGGLKITFSVGWSGPPENIVLGPSHPLGCSVSSSLGPAGIVGGGSECTALSLSTFSTTTRCT